MKKRIMALVLVSVMLMVAQTALAEEFTVHAGVKFGETKEEVKNKETLELDEEADTKLTYKGTVANINNSSIEYYFNDEGYLNDVLYSFPTSTTRDTISTRFDTIESGLVRKYGKSLGNSGGDFYIITGPAFDNAVAFIALMMWLDGTGDVVDYGEWIVPNEEDNVKIDLIAYYTRDSKYNYNYFLMLSYHPFTDEDLKAAQDEKKAENNAVDDDL